MQYLFIILLCIISLTVNSQNNPAKIYSITSTITDFEDSNKQSTTNNHKVFNRNQKIAQSKTTTDFKNYESIIYRYNLDGNIVSENTYVGEYSNSPEWLYYSATTSYHTNNQIKKHTTRDQSNIIYTETEFILDSTNNIAKKIEFQDGRKRTTFYTYDNESRLIKETTPSLSEMFADFVNTYKYNNSGQIIEKHAKSVDVKQVYNYNKKGNKIEYQLLRGDKLDSKILYYYNKNVLIKSIEINNNLDVFDNSGNKITPLHLMSDTTKTINKKIRTYDNQGNSISYQIFENDKITYEITTKYTYNKYKNWTKRETYTDGTLSKITNRAIIYYD